MARIIPVVIAAFAVFHLVCANYSAEHDTSISSEKNPLEKTYSSCNAPRSNILSKGGKSAITKKSRSMALFQLLASVVVISLIGFLVSQCLRSLKQSNFSRSRRLSKTFNCAENTDYQRVDVEMGVAVKEYKDAEDAKETKKSKPVSIIKQARKKKNQKNMILLGTTLAIITIIILAVVINRVASGPGGENVTDQVDSVLNVTSNVTGQTVEDIQTTSAGINVTDPVEVMKSTPAGDHVTKPVDVMSSTPTGDHVTKPVDVMRSTPAGDHVTDPVDVMRSTPAGDHVTDAVDVMRSTPAGNHVTDHVTDPVDVMRSTPPQSPVANLRSSAARNHVKEPSVAPAGAPKILNAVEKMDALMQTIHNDNTVLDYLRSNASEPLQNAVKEIFDGYKGKTGAMAKKLTRNEAYHIMGALKTIYVEADNLVNSVKHPAAIPADN